MPEFTYSARDEDGNRVQGKLEAEDRDAAMKTLSSRYAVVTQLDSTASNSKIQAFLNLVAPVKGEDMLAFVSAMASMVDGGISLKRVMVILYEDIENPALRRVVSDLSSEISAGNTLSGAMDKHPAIFDRFFRAMVKAGETSGNLPEMLRRVASYIEVTEGLKNKVKSALFYPILVVIFAFLLVTAIIVFGVPYLQNIYDGLGLTLPLATRVVVTLGGVLAKHIYIFVLLGAALVYLVFRGLKNESGQIVADRLRLKLPVFSNIFRLLYTARFARTLATLYASGIPMLEALSLVSATIGNRVVAAELADVIDRVKGGEAISTCLRGSPHFSRMAVGMMSAGEEAGTLDAMLNKVADFYEMKVYAALSGLASTLEPLIMMIVGLFIGGIIIVMGLPFMNLASAL